MSSHQAQRFFNGSWLAPMCSGFSRAMLLDGSYDRIDFWQALPQHGTWTLPLPVETLLAWAWQRWELEVVHRAVKSLWQRPQMSQTSGTPFLASIPIR